MPSVDALLLIREKIREAMVAARISEAELSRRTYIPRSTLARKLAGASEFTLPEIIRISQVIGLKPEQIVAAGSAA